MSLYSEKWPVDKELGTVVVVHGAGEYFVRYHWLAGKLNEAGYSVLGGDLPGLGRSGGSKGHIDRFEDYCAALDEWVAAARQHARPLFLLGHSMGGLIVTRYIQERKPDVNGVILSSPCLGLVRTVSPVLESIASLLNTIYPSFKLPSGIKAGDVSRDSGIAVEYGRDPYITKLVSVRWYKELVRAMNLASEEIHSYPDVPTLIMQAGADRIVRAAVTRQWVEKLSIQNKEYIEWEEMYHELFNEPEKEEVMQKTIEWMNKEREAINAK
jgi:lysophospholipase